MPQNHSQLRNLLALLAKFQKSGFAGVLIQKVGNEAHGATIVLSQGFHAGVLEMPAHRRGHVGATLETAMVLLGGIDGGLLRLMLVVG